MHTFGIIWAVFIWYPLCHCVNSKHNFRRENDNVPAGPRHLALTQHNNGKILCCLKIVFWYYLALKSIRAGPENTRFKRWIFMEWTSTIACNHERSMWIFWIQYRAAFSFWCFLNVPVLYRENWSRTCSGLFLLSVFSSLKSWAGLLLLLLIVNLTGVSSFCLVFFQSPLCRLEFTHSLLWSCLSTTTATVCLIKAVSN